MNDVMERMQKARTGLLVSQPFFGTLALRLDLVEDDKVKTMYTDAKQLRFNPEWVMNLPMPEIEAVIAHAVMHCALGHVFRRGNRDPKKWNEACDYPINEELTRAGFQLPPLSLMDDQYKGMFAEAIYSAMDRQSEEQGTGDDQPGKGKGEGSTGGFGDAPPPDDEGGGNADAAEIAEQEADWQTAVAQAAQVARGCGKLPGNVERSIESFLDPRVHWTEALQRYFLRRAKEDHNWSRPNRRHIGSGLYLPSADSLKIGPVAVAIDMSGSISQTDINQFCGELADIRDSVKPEYILVMCFDTQVRGEVLRIENDEPIKIERRAGGGTAFDGPVHKLEEMEVTPEVLVYLTDLDSSMFPREPDYPVLWVSTRAGAAPFGDIIMM